VLFLYFLTYSSQYFFDIEMIIIFPFPAKAHFLAKEEGRLRVVKGHV
jgi:hypothetical protein